MTKTVIENVPKYPEYEKDEKFTICYTCNLEGKPSECHLNCKLNEFIFNDDNDKSKIRRCSSFGTHVKSDICI